MPIHCLLLHDPVSHLHDCLHLTLNHVLVKEVMNSSFTRSFKSARHADKHHVRESLMFGVIINFKYVES